MQAGVLRARLTRPENAAHLDQGLFGPAAATPSRQPPELQAAIPGRDQAQHGAPRAARGRPPVRRADSSQARFTVETSDVDLNKLLADCVEAAKPLAHDKDIELTLDAEPVTALLRRQPPARAARRQPDLERAQVHARGRIRHDDGFIAQNGDVQIEVQDSGIGIPLRRSRSSCSTGSSARRRRRPGRFPASAWG